MSIQAVAWVLESSQSRGLARLVLISLANHHNAGTGQCNPGQRLISQEAGISPGSVPAQIRKLVGLGELVVEQPGTSHRSAQYRITFAQHASEAPVVFAQEPSESDTVTLNPEPSTLNAGPRGTTEPNQEPVARANALAREWWDSYKAKHGRDPMQPFVAARGVIVKAVKAGWTDTQIGKAIPKVGVPLTAFKLQQVLDRAGTSGAPDFDRQSRKRGIG